MTIEYRDPRGSEYGKFIVETSNVDDIHTISKLNPDGNIEWEVKIHECYLESWIKSNT